MPGLHGTQRIYRGTRAPAGVSAPRPSGTGIYREVPLWPGITWGLDARCACSKAVRDGVLQVKVRSGACTVHLPGRVADPDAGDADAQAAAPEAAPEPVPAPRPPAVTDNDLLAACQSGTVTREMYDAAADAWRADHEAALLTALLRPQIAELAGLLLAGSPRPEVTYCPCGREHDTVDALGRRRCSVCRRRQCREASARYQARKRAEEGRQAA